MMWCSVMCHMLGWDLVRECGMLLVMVCEVDEESERSDLVAG